MNHLEQLTSEWLQYCGYFVRTGINVGARPTGGFEGELDVVGLHPGKEHLIHIECSLDAMSWAARERHFGAKFERGRLYARGAFGDLPLPETIDQVALLQFAPNEPRTIGAVRVVTVAAFINEMLRGLAHTSPVSGAVSSNLPLVRTLQLAAAAGKSAAPSDAHKLLP